MTTLVSLVGVLALLFLGAWLTAALDHLAAAWVAQRPAGNALAAPGRRAAAWLVQRQNMTEAPDTLNWRLAPALYLGLGGVGLAVVPLAPGWTLVRSEVGLVLWGAVESLTVVVIFLHGWSANAMLSLIGGYRYVAVGLPIMLVSMFVLIAAALPAESLAVPAVVASQGELWNVVRQPLGLPLFLLLGLALTFRGPFNYADSADLASGTAVEISGAHRANWALARLAMLVAFAAMASTVFLGGYHGPLLPGPLWLVLKTAVLLAMLVGSGHCLARVDTSRMLSLIWTVLMPLAFLDLIIAGIEVL